MCDQVFEGERAFTKVSRTAPCLDLFLPSCIDEGDSDYHQCLCLIVRSHDELSTPEPRVLQDNNLLGKFNLDGIPPAPRGVPQIEVLSVLANTPYIIYAPDSICCVFMNTLR